MVTDERTVINQKMGSKRRTDLKILASKAKNLEESDFEIKKHLAPPKSMENDEKLISETEKKVRFFFLFKNCF